MSVFGIRAVRLLRCAVDVDLKRIAEATDFNDLLKGFRRLEFRNQPDESKPNAGGRSRGIVPDVVCR